MPAITSPQVSSAAAYEGEPVMHFGGHDDAEPGARINVDVGVDAPLTDQSQVRQAFQERGVDLRSLADEDERLGVREPAREFVGRPGCGRSTP